MQFSCCTESVCHVIVTYFQSQGLHCDHLLFFEQRAPKGFVRNPAITWSYLSEVMQIFLFFYRNENNETSKRSIYLKILSLESTTQSQLIRTVNLQIQWLIGTGQKTFYKRR